MWMKIIGKYIFMFCLGLAISNIGFSNEYEINFFKTLFSISSLMCFWGSVIKYYNDKEKENERKE